MSILLEQVSKYYGATPVVSDVTLEIEDGELFVLLGASGSGKSTLLRIIAGLTEANEGAVWLHGKDVTHAPTQDRHVGFVFQNYALFRHMTIGENIEFGMSVRGASRPERAARRDELLELVGLAGMGGRYPRQLSGGQQQRVAVARALAHEPSVLLLDEPFGALDVKIRAQLRQSLRRIQRQLGVTTILVTHDQEEAFELADRIGVIDHGQLLEVGTPVDLYRRPHHPFVAQFVGSATLLAGRWEAGEVSLGALRLPAPTPPEKLPPSGRVALLFRPEDLALRSEGLNGSGAPILGSGTVEESHFLGTLQRVQVRLQPLPGIRSLRPDYGAEEIVVQVVQMAGTADERAFQPGERVQVAIRDFHLIARSSPPLLICADESADEDYLRQVSELLGLMVEEPVTVLLVAESEAGLQRLRQRLAPTLEANARFIVKACVGKGAQEALHELQVHHYDGLVINGEPNEAGAMVKALVNRSPVPVVVMKGQRAGLRRLLLCTAAGEPGKFDILLGGRMARRVGASATLLHVASPTPVPAFAFEHAVGPETRRVGSGLAAQHLEQGRQTLHHLGVRTDVKVRQGKVVEEILAEAREGDYDLIVVGGHLPSATAPLLDHDLASEVVRLADRPVLMVRGDGA